MIFVSIGLIVAAFSRTESTAILATLIIVIPMMFLSGSFYPEEAFSGFIKPVSQYLPVNLAIRLVEGVMYYQLSVKTVVSTMFYLVLYMLISGLIAWIVLKRSIKK